METKNGLELLTSRVPEEAIDISSFESQHSICLPPVYKAFIQAFKMLDDKTLNNSFQFFYAEQDIVRNFGDASHSNEKVLIGAFYELDKLMLLMNSIYSKDDPIWIEDLLLIGTNDMNHSIMVGIGEINQDKIFIERPDLEPRLIRVAEDILNLIRGYKTWPEENWLLGHKLSQLYKNWGEDFWRVREDSD